MKFLFYLVTGAFIQLLRPNAGDAARLLLFPIRRQVIGSTSWTISTTDPAMTASKEGSIQDAVDQAQPGESIYIEPGIYKEQVTINKKGNKIDRSNA